MTARVVAGVAALAVFALATVFGARTASGADALGYVSQAYLWSAGSLHLEQPLLRDARWPYAAESLAPLGYRRSADGRAVPTYPPGVPLTMAAMERIAGTCGPFLVAPFFGAALVFATSLLAFRVTRDPLVATIAPVLMATSPTLLVNVIAPMSDTATAALWTCSLCAVTWHGRRAAVLGGALAGWAVLVRPNLVPVVIAGAVAAEAWRGSSDRRAVRGAAYLAVAAVAALFVAWVNDHLYGSPLLSGYGPADRLYALRHAVRNTAQYSAWLAEAEWPMLILLAAPLLRIMPSAELRRRIAPLVLFASLIGLSYLFYLPFDAWWFLRFLLPAFPVAYIGVAAVVAYGVRRFPDLPRARMASLAAAAAVLFVAVRVLPYKLEIATIGPGEERYSAVARFIAGGLPADSVLIGMQHTGTIRFYAGRSTIRFEWIAPERFLGVLESLRDSGHRPFLVLENWEEEGFRRRFASLGAIGRLEVRMIAELQGAVGVRIYDPLDTLGRSARPFPLQMEYGACATPAADWRTLPLR